MGRSKGAYQMKPIVIQLSVKELSDILQGHKITKQASEDGRESTGECKQVITIKKEAVRVL